MEEYGHILAMGEENLQKVYNEGKLVAVFEKRAVDCKEGYFLIQVTFHLSPPYQTREAIISDSVVYEYLYPPIISFPWNKYSRIFVPQTNICSPPHFYHILLVSRNEYSFTWNECLSQGKKYSVCYMGN